MLKRAKRLTHECLLRLGLVKYRRPFAFDAGTWNDGYAVGENEHFGELKETTRYGALAGYVRAKGSQLCILDVGCGTGLLRSHIEDRQIRRFVGTDISDVAVAAANNLGHERSEFHVCDVPGNELGTFDVIVCNEMLYYVPDVDDYLQHLRGLLKRDGWLITSITRHTGDFTLHKNLDRRFKKLDAVTIKSAIFNAKWRIACYARTSLLMITSVPIAV